MARTSKKRVRAPKKQARAARTAAKGGISKTKFVTDLPTTMPTAEVIAKAKEAGIVLSTNYVYLIRSKAKRAAAKSGLPQAARTQAPTQVALITASASPKAPKAAPARGGDRIESTFTNLVAEIGLTRAESLLRDVRSKFTRG